MMPLCRRLVLATLGAAVVSTAAQAEMTVKRADYSAGVLVVEGNTPHTNQNVSLDGRYSERTGRYGKFVFRVRYLPKNCAVRLKAGSQVQTVTVENCSAPGSAATDNRR
jgi:hypothetical protein